MKKNILHLLMLFLICMIANVGAQDCCKQDFCCYENTCCETNFYARILGGANFLQNTKIDDNRATYNTGYVISGSIGYYWCYGLRVEGEYAYRRNTINKIHFFGQGSSTNGHLQTSSYIANLLWDMPLSNFGLSFCNIQSYIGAGLGLDFQQMHSSNSRIVFNQKWRHFAWQLMAGLTYPIFCNTEISLEYKFHQGGCHFNNHSVGIGLLYKLSL